MNKRAQTKLIEALIVLALVTYTSSAISSLRLQIDSASGHDLILKDISSSTLLTLEQSGLLYKAAITRDFELVYDTISKIIPENIAFKLIVLDAKNHLTLFSRQQTAFNQDSCSSSSFKVLNVIFVLEVSKIES
ncbi:MAG: hypothetical protein DRJ31_06770 [Candidatus Methanomethylicota archaeon]|uniref:Uncharacterized protein n=1 Tax=Thermoproteota archaeon TaxID=2056631 RepID=A0A497EN70_9CREN|nr:MAG: hypothetical protein DRJ31_06770 [Candidatus Verstraetearchaeota archaeon]RLE52120.1 MAG: hypothetical protein DRJ33_04510 [Candidatus Verstraetearchaeota archaeon]